MVMLSKKYLKIRCFMINYFKTPLQIRQEVKKVKDFWGNRGGVILAPSHEALPETLLENIISLYEELDTP